MQYIRKLFQFPRPLLETYPLVWLIPFVLLVGADLGTKKIVTNTLQFDLSPSQRMNRPDPVYLRSNMEKDRARQIDLVGQEGRILKFHLVFNDRFAFSLGPKTPLIGFFISLAAILFLFLYRAHNPDLGHRYAWLIIFSGAVGNLIDKMFIKSLTTGEWFLSLLPQKGHVSGVVDFVQVIWFNWESVRDIPVLSFFSWPFWPTFNLADSLVSTGILVLLLTIRFEKETEKSTAAESN